MTSILEHPSIAGSLNHASGASGGEHAGPCPWCGGTDRFRVWGDHPSGAVGGRFLCRGCGRQGDGIAFLRELEGLSYTDACKRLGTTPKDRTRQNGRDVRVCPVWTPKPFLLPSDAWTSAAGRFVEYAAGQMAASAAGRAYAASRGLTLATVAALRIGWSAQDAYEDRTAWGLPPEVNPKTGKPRRVWSPSGLTIPTLRNGQVVAIKIRRAAWTPEDELPKYAAVVGSAKAPMILAPGQGRPVVVVESELDAILVAQEARDIVTAIALRTAKAKPDAEAHDMLKAAPLVLVATDADEAGATAWPWWREHYPKAIRWPVPAGKDVGDLAATPGLVRAWIEAGLPDPERTVEPEPTPEPFSSAVGPALCQAADLAAGQPCPYPQDYLAAFAASHAHLRCCPATKPPWNWRESSWCSSRCPTPCELQATN
ncbi:primase-helicase zinc-binding domain-containing protein [Solidesulfovibrio sp.]